MNGLPTDLLTEWALSSVTTVADTPRSRIFRALDRGGRSVIVKLLKPAGEDERTGFDYLARRNGQGTVKLLARTDNACLLEDAGSVTLADWQRRHGDEAATAIAVDVISALHAPVGAQWPTSLVTLQSLFTLLFHMASSHRGTAERALLRHAAATAERLLRMPGEMRPLHGDVHHDNILTQDGKSWLAIDPKGYLGSPVYEVANLFGNPLGATETILDPRRIQRLAETFAPFFSASPDHVLDWAIAHAGLSACWSLDHPDLPDEADNAAERLAFTRIASALLP